MLFVLTMIQQPFDTWEMMFAKIFLMFLKSWHQCHFFQVLRKLAQSRDIFSTSQDIFYKHNLSWLIGYRYISTRATKHLDSSTPSSTLTIYDYYSFQVHVGLMIHYTFPMGHTIDKFFKFSTILLWLDILDSLNQPSL